MVKFIKKIKEAARVISKVPGGGVSKTLAGAARTPLEIASPEQPTQFDPQFEEKAGQILQKREQKITKGRLVTMQRTSGSSISGDLLYHLQQVYEGTGEPVGEEQTLTPLQYQRWGETVGQFPGIKSGPEVTEQVKRSGEQARQQQELRGLEAEDPSGFKIRAPPGEQGLTSRDILGSTVRETAPGAAAKGAGIAAGAAGTIAGFSLLAAPATGGASAAIGLPIAAGVAAVTFMSSVGYDLFKAYKSNQQEEVNNAWQGFRGMKVGVPQTVTSYNRGSIGPTQLKLNQLYESSATDYYIGALHQKQQNGDFDADISDYDGKMAYALEWRDGYLWLQHQEGNAAVAEGRQIEVLQAPIYEGEED